MTKALTWTDLRIVRPLGSGQAGWVYLARLEKDFRELAAGSEVAVKRYKGWVMDQPGQYERVFRELDAGRSVAHPNLVETLTLVADPDGRPALVMRYFEGETLDHYLAQRRSNNAPVDPESALSMLGKLAGAVASLHRAQIIHRDVKLANILLAGDEPILMDLGVVQTAKFPEQTTTNAFLGTIRYSAPEYLFGEDYDDSIDVFSLGAVAWEVLAGRQYLSDESNWARMISRKSAKRRVPFDFDPIQNRFGTNGVEFVKALFALTLGPRHERISADKLTSALQSELWKHPFHRARREISAGEPLCSAIGDWSRSPSNRIPFAAAWAEFLARTNEDDRTLLRAFLDLHYWENDTPISYFGEPDRSHLASLVIRGIVQTEYHESTWMCDVHEVVRLGYRFRRL